MNKFKFSKENTLKVNSILASYPRKISAVVPLLLLAQKQNNGFVNKQIIEVISDYCDIEVGKVNELISFYTMLKLKPVGQHHFQVCRTLSCWLSHKGSVKEYFKNELKIGEGDISKDNLFSFEEVECLGACDQAPVIIHNEKYKMNCSLDKLKNTIRKIKDA